LLKIVRPLSCPPAQPLLPPFPSFPVFPKTVPIILFPPSPSFSPISFFSFSPPPLRFPSVPTMRLTSWQLDFPRNFFFGSEPSLTSFPIFFFSGFVPHPCALSRTTQLLFSFFSAPIPHLTDSRRSFLFAFFFYLDGTFFF